jgi:hypothetical protein
MININVKLFMLISIHGCSYLSETQQEAVVAAEGVAPAANWTIDVVASVPPEPEGLQGLKHLLARAADCWTSDFEGDMYIHIGGSVPFYVLVVGTKNNNRISKCIENIYNNNIEYFNIYGSYETLFIVNIKNL